MNPNGSSSGLRAQLDDLRLDDSWIGGPGTQVRRAHLCAAIEGVWNDRFTYERQRGSVAERNMHSQCAMELLAIADHANEIRIIDRNDDMAGLAHTAINAAGEHSRQANDIWAAADIHDCAWHAGPWSARRLAEVSNGAAAQGLSKYRFESPHVRYAAVDMGWPGELDAVDSHEKLVAAFATNIPQRRFSTHAHRQACESDAQAALDVERRHNRSHVVIWTARRHWWDTRRPGLGVHVGASPTTVLCTVDPAMWETPYGLQPRDTSLDGAVELPEAVTHTQLTAIADTYNALEPTRTSLEAAVALVMHDTRGRLQADGTVQQRLA